MEETFTDFSAVLLRWYSTHKRDLPWRGTRNPYYVWLSEVILQQTRIAQGLPYYLNFIAQFPTVKDLADAPEERVLKVWQGLGYYSRAKNLQAAAKHITYELEGEFPSTYKELLTLKGVGDYTASTIASICYDEPKASVDGNVYRVLSRIFGIETPINTSEGIKYFKELASVLLDEKKAGEYNQALMDFGAIQCKPQSPNCQECVMNTKCWAFKEQKVNQLPVKLPKVKVKHRYFHYCVLKDNDAQTLLLKRTEKDIWQGLYQFPCIETAKEVNDVDALMMIKKKYVKARKIEKHTQHFIHKLTHQHIYATFWSVEVDEVLPQGIPLSAVHSLPMPALIVKFLDSLKD